MVTKLFCNEIKVMKKNSAVKKIAVIGAGNVGSTAAYTLMLKGLAAQVLLIDINDKKEKGEVLDIADGLCFAETGCVKGGNFADAADADLIILSAGVAQKPGETRLQLADKNKTIARDIFRKIGKVKSSAVIIVVANPVDVITYTVQQAVKLPKSQIFGSGTALETARLKTVLGHLLKVNPHSVEGFVVGEHGDSGLVAWSSVIIGGLPIRHFIKSDKELKKLEQKIKNEVYDIIKRKGATYFGIASVIAELAEAVVLNQQRVLPVTSRLKHWNGISGLCLGAPAVIGQNGVDKLWPLTLTATEKKQLAASAKKIKSYL